jgi:hypothetical protein
VTTFQLDENNNYTQLAEQCNNDGACTVLRFPARLRGTKDQQLLPMLLSENATLVTTDFTIVSDNRDSVPNPNAGIIVVKSRSPKPPFTATRAVRFIVQFKNKFPAWATINWAGLYIEISEAETYICALTEGDVSGGISFEFQNATFSDQLLGAIAMIRERLRLGVTDAT